MSNLVKRSLTGFIFLIVMVGALWLGQFTFLTLVTFILITSLIEFYQLIEKLGHSTRNITGIILGVFFLAITYLHAQELIEGKWLLLSILSIVVIPFIEFLKPRPTSFQNTAYTLTGLLLIALPLALSNYIVFTGLSNGAYDHRILLYVFILIWTYDTFAYLSGKYLGRHKLLERVSPKKTWEGTFGGLLSGIGVSVIIFYLSGIFSLSHWVIISVLTSIFGTLGDLTESSLKRTIKVKDSGSLLPGHGGVLDRFDAVYFVIPVVFVYLHLFVF